MSKDVDEQKKLVAESHLKGNTLRTYLYVVKHKRSGVREIQRELHFSSSSLAQYHLTKLVDLGLLKENTGEYILANEIKVDMLNDFLRFGTLMVPRFVFYAVFFSILSGFFGFVEFFRNPMNGMNALFVALLIGASAIFWYEAIRAWIKGPA